MDHVLPCVLGNQNGIGFCSYVRWILFLCEVCYNWLYLFFVAAFGDIVQVHGA